jgi:anti-sigma regulatory factor (Ser/Thr protein kinase)
MGLATRVGFDETDIGRVALVVTEAATNIVKHAGKGQILLRAMNGSDGDCGVEVIALDRGPGMVDVASCFRDGYSTAGSSGTGLGAISRLANDFETYTRSGGGTALWIRVYPKGHRSVASGDAIGVGSVGVTAPGENVSGDDWTFSTDDQGVTILLVDGLGHGPEAAKASRAAVNAFRPRRSPELILADLHGAVQTTRGAAASCATVDFQTESVVFAGVGNVAGAIFGSTGPRNLVTQNGTLGTRPGRIRAFDYPWSGGSCLVMWTDGLTSHVSAQDYPGLLARHPSLVAAVLYRDFVRGRDDATIVVAKDLRSRI